MESRRNTRSHHATSVQEMGVAISVATTTMIVTKRAPMTGISARNLVDPEFDSDSRSVLQIPISPQLAHESGKVSLEYAPNNVQIDGVVPMNEAVP